MFIQNCQSNPILTGAGTEPKLSFLSELFNREFEFVFAQLMNILLCDTFADAQLKSSWASRETKYLHPKLLGHYF